MSLHNSTAYQGSAVTSIPPHKSDAYQGSYQGSKKSGKGKRPGKDRNNISDAQGTSAPFPQNFQDVVKTIFKQLFRVYAHIYHLHFQMIMSLKEEAHLNTYCGENFETFVIKQIETVDKAFENDLEKRSINDGKKHFTSNRPYMRRRILYSALGLFDVNVAMRPHIAQDLLQQCFPTNPLLTIDTESKRGDQLMIKLMVSSSSSNFRRYNRPYENKPTKDGGAILTSNRRNAKSRILDNAFRSINADVALKSQIGHGHLQQRGVWICCETKLSSIFQSKERILKSKRAKSSQNRQETEETSTRERFEENIKDGSADNKKRKSKLNYQVPRTNVDKFQDYKGLFGSF
ncbi:MOB kinase activator-like 1A protein [Tanacetum coccineum]